MQITLRYDSWHRRLQERIWGPVYFQNFCPYFWLTIFCVLASPFFFAGVLVSKVVRLLARVLPPIFAAIFTVLAPLGYVINKVLGFVIGGIIELFDAFLCMPLERATLARLGEDRILGLYNRSRDRVAERYGYDLDRALRFLLADADTARDRRLFARMDAKFQVWKDLAGDNWKEQLAEMRKRKEERESVQQEAVKKRQALKAQAEQEAEAKRRRTLNAIVKYTKMVVPVLLALLAIPVLYGVFRLALAIFRLPWMEFFRAILSLPVFLVQLAVAFGHAMVQLALGLVKLVKLFTLAEWGLFLLVPLAGYVLIKISRKCDLEVPFQKLGELIKLVLEKTIIKAVDALVAFCEFVWEYVKLFKKEHCPQINWVR